MQVLAVNIGKPQPHSYQGKAVQSGIVKNPVERRVRVTQMGLAGDGQADLDNHGGVDKALYVYTHENYDHWETELAEGPYPFGQFGENLTVHGLPDEAVHIGDRLRIGSVLTEVTQPRVPCFKLAMRMGMTDFPRRFLSSGRVGFYLRVVEVGDVGAGDAIVCEFTQPQRVSIRVAMHALLPVPQRAEIIDQLLQLDALSAAWRQKLREKLEKF